METQTERQRERERKAADFKVIFPHLSKQVVGRKKGEVLKFATWGFNTDNSLSHTHRHNTQYLYSYLMQST